MATTLEEDFEFVKGSYQLLMYGGKPIDKELTDLMRALFFFGAESIISQVKSETESAMKKGGVDAANALIMAFKKREAEVQARRDSRLKELLDILTRK